MEHPKTKFAALGGILVIAVAILNCILQEI